VKRWFSVLVVALLAVTAAACSSSSSKPSKTNTSSAIVTDSQSAPKGKLEGSITVYAASSLTGAFTTLKTMFIKAHPGVFVTTTFGASSALATQIEQAAPVDVFASAAPANMDSVVRAGQATDPVNFVSNSLEVAVPPSNPGKVTKLADLAKSNVQVAVCASAVPCGVVATKVFANAKIKVKPKASLADVKSTLAAVESGNVDAGLVYITDVKAAGAKVKGVVIPSSVNSSTEYPIAALSHAKNPTLAKAWVSFVLSPTGKQVLAQDGFASP
jgi:molybdate transport system substrate-binding protein